MAVPFLRNEKTDASTRLREEKPHLGTLSVCVVVIVVSVTGLLKIESIPSYHLYTASVLVIPLKDTLDGGEKGGAHATSVIFPTLS
jgi:hypothetical protein